MKRKKLGAAARQEARRAASLLRAMVYIRVAATNSARGRFPIGCTSAYSALGIIADRASHAENAFRKEPARPASAPKNIKKSRPTRSPEEAP